MKTKKTRFLLLLAIGLTVFFLAQAGDLEPPGPPASTMLTLTEVAGGRIPIRASDLPMTIDAPGSYYLVEDIAVTAIDFDYGIAITVDDVSIDLMGHALSLAYSAGYPAGITTLGEAHNTEVRNGTISNWYTGISLEDRARVIDVRTRSIQDNILLGDHAFVKDVQVTSSAFVDAYGITVGDNSVIRDCVVSTMRDGIAVGSESLITHCALSGGAGISVTGSGNSVFHNTLQGSGPFIDFGIYIFGDGNFVVDNTVSDHLVGIWVSVGNGNRIDGNHLFRNGTGLSLEGENNLIVRNDALLNGVAYVVVGPNDVGPIADAATTTSPWANFSRD